MTTVVNSKARIIEIAHELGFHQVSIGSLAPMPEALTTYQAWLDKGYAASMDYLKRDPSRRTDPSKTCPEAKSVIIVAVSYFSEPPPVPPEGSYGRVARYAVGLDYHAVIRAKLRELCSRVELALGMPLQRRAVTDDAALYEQALAARHGMGFIGKNSLLIGPKMSGSYNLIGELFVDVELEPDFAYTGTCGECFRCGSACPTNAIKSGAMIDSNACISFLTIENKHGIDLAMREGLGDWVFGCDICQEVCPYNQKAALAPWPEFSAQSGVGHYLNLIDLLSITDQETFIKRFEKSPVRRPKRRGLLRNALVVMGNQLAGDHAASEQIIDAIDRFVATESDSMLLEHAAWAASRTQKLGQSSSIAARGRGIIERVLAGALEQSSRMEIAKYV